jgi:alpha-methylacyl-CoA racemase
VRVVEVGGIGPNPFVGMLLADMGATVTRVDRASALAEARATRDPTMRSRHLIPVDLKDPDDVARVLALADAADALIEGFRPGAMERLGLGPEVLLARNPRLVYGRITGYGQDGPMAQVAGHDINYLALTGVLDATRCAGGEPAFALNLVADYGGGAMLLAFGVVCALLEARGSGRGQVVDAAMVDGVSLLTTLIHGLRTSGRWPGPPGTNLLDGGAHFYSTYATADGGHVAVGAIEPRFYARLLELLGLSPAELPQHDRDRWPEFRARLASVFATRTTAQWAAILDREEACATVVRDLMAARDDPHLVARATFVEVDGVRQPAPAPRFSRTPGCARPAQVADG